MLFTVQAVPKLGLQCHFSIPPSLLFPQDLSYALTSAFSPPPNPSLLPSCLSSFHSPHISLPCLFASFLAPENSYIYMLSSLQSAKCVKHSLEINGPWAMQRSQKHHMHSLAQTVGRLLVVVWMLDGNGCTTCIYISLSYMECKAGSKIRHPPLEVHFSYYGDKIIAQLMMGSWILHVTSVMCKHWRFIFSCHIFFSALPLPI